MSLSPFSSARRNRAWSACGGNGARRGRRRRRLQPRDGSERDARRSERFPRSDRAAARRRRRRRSSSGSTCIRPRTAARSPTGRREGAKFPGYGAEAALLGRERPRAFGHRRSMPPEACSNSSRHSPSQTPGHLVPKTREIGCRGSRQCTDDDVHTLGHLGHRLCANGLQPSAHGVAHDG